MMLSSIGEMDRSSHLHPFTSVPGLLHDGPLVIRRGKGVIVEDERGRELIDAAAGLWCVNVGYGRDEIVSAVAEQMNRLAFSHTFNGMTHEPVAKLSAHILTRAPSGMRRVFFGNSGSDANDTAIKLVVLYNNLRGKRQKKKIVARWRGYHGVTVAAGSLTGLAGVHRLFDLPLSTVRHIDPPDQYREPERTAVDYARQLEETITSEGPDTVAAFIAEPVMGTGGVLVPPEDYFGAIREVLDRHDVLLILDEVICGFGRLGTWFGADRFNVVPDLMTTAKGLTSGYLPMSAVIIGEHVWSVIEASRNIVGVFGHGFTTSGHPAAAAAALANLDIIERENLVQRTRQLGPRLLSRLADTLADHPMVGDVRGCGMMVGVELVANRGSRQSYATEAQVAGRVARAAIETGLLVRALPANDVIAFSPAFVITPDVIDECAVRFLRALDKVSDQLRKEAA
jgi:L-2,4-diaminobutyrate transaminase